VVGALGGQVRGSPGGLPPLLAGWPIRRSLSGLDGLQGCLPRPVRGLVRLCQFVDTVEDAWRPPRPGPPPWPPPRQHLHLSVLRPGGQGMTPPGPQPGPCLCYEAQPAGRWAVPEDVREGRIPPIDFPRNANRPAGVTGQQQPPRPPTPGVERQLVARWPCAAKVQHQQRRMRVEGHRDGPFTPPGGGATLWPSCSPLVRSAGSAAARFGEHGAVWAIRKFPSIVHGYQSPIPRLARTAVGVPTNRLRSIDAGHDLGDDVSARLRGYGRDQTVMAARSRAASPVGWTVSPP
jgi:hypothetical protein